jgi:hypothetical protein
MYMYLNHIHELQSIDYRLIIIGYIMDGQIWIYTAHHLGHSYVKASSSFSVLGLLILDGYYNT